MINIQSKKVIYEALNEFYIRDSTYILGVFLLLSNIHVSSLSFYILGNINSASILIILSVILGTRFTFAYMSALDLVLMIYVFAVGLVLRGLVHNNK